MKEYKTNSKKYNISDQLLKQILKNLTLIRNICAHSDRLYSFRSKSYISFKYIEKGYNSGNVTNLYMVTKCMMIFLNQEQKKSLLMSLTLK